MLSLKYKDLKFRKNFSQLENLSIKNRFVLSFLLNKRRKLKLFSDRLLFYSSKKQKLLTSKTKIVNKCIFTFRNRGVFRSFGLSRIVLRNLMRNGTLPGFKKAV